MKMTFLKNYQFPAGCQSRKLHCDGLAAESYDISSEKLFAFSRLHLPIDQNQSLADGNFRFPAAFGQSPKFEKLAKFDRDLPNRNRTRSVGE